MSDVDSVLSLLFGKRRRVKKRSAKRAVSVRKKENLVENPPKNLLKKQKKFHLL